MNALVMQNFLVSLILAACLLVVLRRVVPTAFRRWQTTLARHLGRSHRPRWVRALGRALQPGSARQGACGSGSGCASCSGCGVAPSSMDAIPLVIRPRPSGGPPSR
jgi:hypothetical protein